MAKRVKVLHGKRKGYATDGTVDSSDALPNLDFLQMVAQNPRGWGNGPALPEGAPAPTPDAMTPGAAMMKLISGAAQTEPPRLTDPKQVGEAALATMPFNPLKALGRFPRVATTGYALTSPMPAGSDEADKKSIMDLQRTLQKEGYYSGQIDGVMGEGTKTANALYQKHQAESATQDLERAQANAALTRAGADKAEADRKAAADVATQQARQKGEESFTKAEAEVPSYERMFREYAPITGTLGGIALGAGAKAGVNAGSNYLSKEAANRADALMASRAADLPARVGRLNQFWAEGQKPILSSPVAPFAADPNAPLGFKAAQNAPPASSLYQPSPVRDRASDLAALGTFGADWAFGAQSLVPNAAEELRRSQEAYGQDPSEVNVRRIEAAKDNLAFANAVENTGRGAVAGYGLTAKFAHRSPSRPDTARAEAERLRINQEIAPPQPAASSAGLPPLNLNPTSPALPAPMKALPAPANSNLPALPNTKRARPRQEGKSWRDPKTGNWTSPPNESEEFEE